MTPTRPPRLLTPFQPTFPDCPNKEQKVKDLGQLPEDASTCLCSQENRDRVKVCEKRALPYVTLQKGEWPGACHRTVCLHVDNVYELTHSLSSSGNSSLVRTQLNLTLGPSCGRQRLIPFPPPAGPRVDCLLVPNCIFCTVPYAPYLGQQAARPKLPLVPPYGLK